MKIDADAWYDPSNDIVDVKVRMIVKDENGDLIKKGLIIRFSEERLREIAEGMTYPVVNVRRFSLNNLSIEKLPAEKVESNSMDRFEQINEELDD